mmetsp:Transcript_11857/g.32749  ORF Transcript_11857/g.32749 Transcript_11857/m.32749 type:complete len:281 (-) Transcript_11857:60-902(-)
MAVVHSFQDQQITRVEHGKVRWPKPVRYLHEQAPGVAELALLSSPGRWLKRDEPALEGSVVPVYSILAEHDEVVFISFDGFWATVIVAVLAENLGSERKGRVSSRGRCHVVVPHNSVVPFEGHQEVSTTAEHHRLCVSPSLLLQRVPFWVEERVRPRASDLHRCPPTLRVRERHVQPVPLVAHSHHLSPLPLGHDAAPPTEVVVLGVKDEASHEFQPSKVARLEVQLLDPLLLHLDLLRCGLDEDARRCEEEERYHDNAPPHPHPHPHHPPTTQPLHFTR